MGTTQSKNKAISFIDKNHMILEAIEESPASRSHLKIEDGQELNFESLMEQNSLSPTGGQPMVIDDEEEDGLPKTCEDHDVFVLHPRISGEIPDGQELREPHSSSAIYLGKRNSKSRSFAEPQQAVKLFGNSFGKGSSREGNKHNNSFLSVSNPRAHQDTN